jgi:O-antigen ligase
VNTITTETTQPKQTGVGKIRHRLLTLPPAAATISLIAYAILNIVFIYLMSYNPILGIAGAIVLNLTVLLFLRSRYAFPIYILVAGPSLALKAFGSSGTLSRLFIGDLIFAFVVGVWILQIILPARKSGKKLLDTSLLLPLVCLILIGIISIIYSHLYPDPNVVYQFPHSTTSIYVTNAAEITLLLGLPMFLILVPALMRSLRDVKWAIGAYTAIGYVYALLTILAGPLGLGSHEVILGNVRPKVLGEDSSTLGTLILVFTCVSLAQALYAKKTNARVFWWVTTAIFSLAVIMSFGREAWVGLFLVTVVMLFLRTKSWAVLLMFFIPLLLLFDPSVTNFFNPQVVYGSDRFTIWQDAINIWQQHGLYFGVGAGNYQFFDRVYGLDKVGVAHNQYVEVLAEMGLQGLICFLWLLAAMGWRAYKGFTTATTALGKAVALTYVGYFVSSLFSGFFTDIIIPSAALGGGTGPFIDSSYRWLLLGLLLSIPVWEKEAVRQEVQEEPTVEVEAVGV